MGVKHFNFRNQKLENVRMSKLTFIHAHITCDHDQWVIRLIYKASLVCYSILSALNKFKECLETPSSIYIQHFFLD